MSVITSHACMVIDSDVTLQTSEDLKPKTWLFEPDNQKLIDSLKRVADCTESYFRETRNMLLEDSVRFLEKNIQQLQNDLQSDMVDNLVQYKKSCENEKVCNDCRAANDPSYLVCRNCKGSLRKRKFSINTSNADLKRNKFSPYNHSELQKSSIAVHIKVGEPDLINPSGFENISTILENLA